MADTRKKLFYRTVIIMILFAGMMLLTACAAKQPAVSPDVAKPLEPKAIQSIAASEETDRITIEIGSNRLLTYTSVKKPSPLSVVLYFPETVVDTTATDIVVENEIIHSVTASAISS